MVRRTLFILLSGATLLVAAGAAAFAQDAGPTPIPVTGPIVDLSDQPIDGPLEVRGGEVAGPNAAAKPTGIPTHPIEILQQMSFWLVPFVTASIIALWFAIERMVVLRRTRVIPPSFVEPFLDSLEERRLDEANATDLCEKNASPIAAVFLHGIHKWGRPSVEVEQAIIDGGERQVGQLRRHLRVLNGVATVTPLIGLLGTVIGMIQAFNDIASSGAMGKADQLAAGIAIALLTTAFGLAIAIPSLVMFMYLSGKVESLVLEMDELAQRVVRQVSAEGLSVKRRPAPRVRSTVEDANSTQRTESVPR
ncbi:MotA/TolQ/ExbB proton channel family protein [bacterium]|nr:MotA/TolQ/ExbB proton channel family protein [bacterium]